MILRHTEPINYFVSDWPISAAISNQMGGLCVSRSSFALELILRPASTADEVKRNLSVASPRGSIVMGSPWATVQSQLISTPRITTGRSVKLSRAKLTSAELPGLSILTGTMDFRGKTTKPSCCCIHLEVVRLNNVAKQIMAATLKSHQIVRLNSKERCVTFASSWYAAWPVIDHPCRLLASSTQRIIFPLSKLTSYLWRVKKKFPLFVS